MITPPDHPRLAAARGAQAFDLDQPPRPRTRALRRAICALAALGLALAAALPFLV